VEPTWTTLGEPSNRSAARQRSAGRDVGDPPRFLRYGFVGSEAGDFPAPSDTMAGMAEPRKRADWAIIVGLAVLLLLLTNGVVYIVGYFAMGTAVPSLSGGELLRVYPAEWQATVFVPAAKVESILRGIRVEVEAES
jgi:hypothetical protein